MYDPDYIQIPEKFQSLLRAYDAEDIKNKVEWFNANDEFRLNLLKEMKEYYNIDGFASDWEAAITHAFEQMR
jgi:benzoyl-CoA reductase/2-hydroxyglutaryl-CoA dehydratase subunit BcrC/BadD/HgdB